MHLGKIISAMSIWVVKPEDGGLWAWTRRWPKAVNGMDKAKLDEFFFDMEKQHHAVMGTNPHICKSVVLEWPLGVPTCTAPG